MSKKEICKKIIEQKNCYGIHCYECPLSKCHYPFLDNVISAAEEYLKEEEKCF